MSAGEATITDDVGGILDLTGGTASVTVTVGDNKGNGSQVQPMPKGTTIEAETSNGSIVGPSSYTVTNSNVNSPIDYVFTVEPDTTSSSGALTITVTSPSGIISIYNITVND